MDDKIKFPDIGKISPEFFRSVIYPSLGAKRKEVLVGPTHGVDTAVIRTSPGKVIIITTDPIYIVPQYGWEEAAWFAWHIIASDVTTSGFPPSYVIVDFNLPMSITEGDFEKIWKVFNRESQKYGASIVSGHTARYIGTDYPMIGGATFISVGEEDSYLTPQMAEPGDILCMTKSAAIEAVGIFSRIFKSRIEKELGSEIAQRGWSIFNQMSTVDDAILAASYGVRDAGVAAMHDATECGVVGAAVEMAHASGSGLVLNWNDIIVYPEIKSICSIFEMQPEISISEGTLILAVKEKHWDSFQGFMINHNSPVTKIGRFLSSSDGITSVRDGKRTQLNHPRVDPFWSAFDKASKSR